MTDRPILFSGAMVNTILEGRKTQTRRVVTPNTTTFDGGAWCNFVAKEAFRLHDAWVDNSFVNSPILKVPWDKLGAALVARVRPRIEVGDRLYVRETVVREETDQGVGYEVYAADHKQVYPLTKWYHKRTAVPSIHMPRWASRLTLVVTDVRVQRVQEIDSDDAMSEGVDLDYQCCGNMDVAFDLSEHGEPINPRQGECCGNPVLGSDPRDAFIDLWDSINDARGHGWDANPWVVAVTFETHKCNIDQMGGKL